MEVGETGTREAACSVGACRVGVAVVGIKNALVDVCTRDTIATVAGVGRACERPIGVCA